jgi:hypothetical protein
LGPAFLTLADATAAMQRGFDSWNDNPASFIDMQIVGQVANPGLRGFDFKNELTFRTATTFNAIASSPSTSLIQDVTLAHGTDIDGDGDSDVSNAIATCSDVDADGDIEFPAGFYKAGTILDNDVQYNTKTSNGLRFTVLDSAVDNIGRSVDLECIAVHEVGHSHGLAHVMNNNKSAASGRGGTMFPFIDTGDPQAELDQRVPDSDDLAWSAYTYPEGSAASGPAALQAGDVDFDDAYGLIKGSVTHGVLNQPIAGASVGAYDWNTGELVSTGYSGTTQVAFNPVNGALGVVSPAYNILDGNYVIPVPKGSYAVGVEALDGSPVGAANVSISAQLGQIFGQLNFNEEFWNLNNEGAIEVRAGEAMNVHVNEGETQTGIDIVTNRQIGISNFGNRNFIGFTLSPAGRYYAVQIPASQIAAIAPGEDIYIHAGAFDTAIVDASVVPAFAEATLTTGTVSGATATLDFANPLARVTGFIGADNDFAPLYFHEPHELGKRVKREIDSGDIENLFLVLRVPLTTPFPGVSLTPPLIGLDGGVPVNDVPIFGFSFLSDDGGATFTRVTNFNFRFSLLVSETD